MYNAEAYIIFFTDCPLTLCPGSINVERALSRVLDTKTEAVFRALITIAESSTTHILNKVGLYWVRRISQERNMIMQVLE